MPRGNGIEDYSYPGRDCGDSMSCVHLLLTTKGNSSAIFFISALILQYSALTLLFASPTCHRSPGSQTQRTTLMHPGNIGLGCS